MSGEEVESSAAGGRAGEGVARAREEDNIGRERKTNAPDPVHTANGRPILTGWPFIEEWMTTLDKGMVSDFNDDINTLLTFAGLFSAVLAGFLVQLYVGLQPSNNQDTNNLLAQNTMELRQISRQLANSSFVPVDIPLPSPSFQAGASIVWINTLWFLSLILSLASALFGMISKQWLREYLQWTTMSGLSEDQVGLRQGRYEAFKDWNTPAIIASMPVLLELALILFLLGMEALLWTLNTVVFGVCTVAVIAIIVLVITVTVLPVFRARCPYKSPVGWAAVLARSAMFSLYNRCLDLYKAFRDWLGSNIFQAGQHHLDVIVDKDWRAWDLSRQTWGSGDERAPYYLSGGDVGRHRMQARALLWIAETSQDQRLLRAVEESIASRTLLQGWTPVDRLVVDFYIACAYLGLDPSQLVPPEDKCARWDELDEGRVIDIRGLGRWRLQFRLRLASNDQWQEHELPVDVDMPLSAHASIAHMLVCDLQTVVSQYNGRHVVLHWKQVDYILQASLLVCEWLALTADDWDRPLSAALTRLATLFERFCREYDTLPLPLRPLFPLLAMLLNYEPRLRQPLLLPNDLQRTRVVLTVPTGRPEAWSEASCSLFALLAQLALHEWATEHDLSHTKALLPPLLDRMAACVLRCLDQCWESCAIPLWFTWLANLRVLFDPDSNDDSRFSGQHLPSDLFPHDLVKALEQYNDAGLLSWNLEHLSALVSRSASLRDQHTASRETTGNISNPGSQPHHTPSAQAQLQSGRLLPSDGQPLASPSQVADPSGAPLVSNDLPDAVLPVHLPSPDGSTLSQHMDIADASPSLSTQLDSDTARCPQDQSISQPYETGASASTRMFSDLGVNPPLAASLENGADMIEMQDIRRNSQVQKLEGAANEAATRPSHSSNVSQILQVHDAAGMVPATTAQRSTHSVASTPYHTGFDNPASTKNEAPADREASQDVVVRTMNNQPEIPPPDVFPFGSAQEPSTDRPRARSSPLAQIETGRRISELSDGFGSCVPDTRDDAREGGEDAAS